MDRDPLLLSRIQFAFVVSFHIIFPAFTIGLAAGDDRGDAASDRRPGLPPRLRLLAKGVPERRRSGRRLRPVHSRKSSVFCIYIPHARGFNLV